MTKLYNNGESISQADLITPLSTTNPELLPYLSTGFNDRYSSNSLIPWVLKLRMLRDKRKHKELLESSIEKISTITDDNDYLDMINAIPEKLLEIQNNDAISDRKLVSSIDSFLSYVASRQTADDLIKTGLNDLDYALGGGFRKGSLVAIGAPPSAGKTQFATKLCSAISTQYPAHNSIIFSLEMTRHAITEKMLEHISGMPAKDMDGDQLLEYGEQFGKMKIYITDKSPVNIEYIRSICRSMSLKGELSVIMVDYLDMMQKPKGSKLRTDEVLADINIQLAQIAKDFNCIVILLTQLSKNAINKASKRPAMSDSKNTNGTAESTDYWLGIKRIGQWDIDKKYADSNLVEIIIDKNRYGNQNIVYFNLKYGYIYQEINQTFAKELVQQANNERKTSHNLSILNMKNYKSNQDWTC